MALTTPKQELAKYLTQSQMSSFFIDKMGIISVKSYGATGDGVTDDTGDIQDAIDAAVANGNKIIFFPHGTYNSQALTNTEGLIFLGDNSSFVGDLYTVTQFGAGSADLDIYNVIDYGAAGDGVTDDSAAIQNAINAANTAGGGIVYIPEGTFLANFDISANVTVQGASMGGTIIKAKTLTENVIDATGSYWALKDITIDGDSTTGSGLYMYGCQGFNVKNIFIKNCGNAGFECNGYVDYGNYYGTVENVRSGITGSPNNIGFKLWSQDSSYRNAVITFIGCHAQYNTTHGWDLDYINCSFYGCSAEGNGAGSAGYGFKLDHTFTAGFLGGYTENNGNTTTDGFNFTANAVRVTIVGVRNVDGYGGTINSAGNVFMFTSSPFMKDLTIGAKLYFDATNAAFDTNLYRHAANILRTDDKFVANLGIGVGNSAVAASMGAVARRAEIFDSTGGSLGYVAIYSS